MRHRKWEMQNTRVCYPNWISWPSLVWQMKGRGVGGYFCVSSHLQTLPENIHAVKTSLGELMVMQNDAASNCVNLQEFQGNMGDKTCKTFTKLTLCFICSTSKTEYCHQVWSHYLGKKPQCAHVQAWDTCRKTLLAENLCHHPLNTLRNVPVASGQHNQRRYPDLNLAMKQIPWHRRELFAPDGPPGLLVNPVLRLCHKEA